MSETWWAISAEALLAALRRAHAGEDPGLLYAEHYANSDHEDVEPGEEIQHWQHSVSEANNKKSRKLPRMACRDRRPHHEHEHDSDNFFFGPYWCTGVKCEPDR